MTIPLDVDLVHLESMSMLLHPLPEDVACLLQDEGRECEAQVVSGLLDAAHSLALLFFRGAVRLCGAELRLQGFEIGCCEASCGVRVPAGTLGRASQFAREEDVTEI